MKSKKQKFLSVFFILSVLIASIALGIVDASGSNETWKFLKDNIQSFSLVFRNKPVSTKTSASEPKVSVFKEQLIPVLFKPTRIYSPDVQLSAVLEEIGLEESGALGTPKNWQSAGWYTKSALPGEEGNIIVDGHYDTNTGAPAAFWELKNLELNDRVVLVDELGRNFTYKITNLVYVDVKDSNRLEILKESDGPTLTLVTCGGVWLAGEGTYNKRLILKAELISKTPSFDLDS